MGSSHAYQISKALEVITTVSPKSLLDVGTGYGKYGYLSREYLDESYLRSDKKETNVVIDGIEGFPEYVNPVHKFVYNDLHIGDAHQIFPTLNTHYDLVLLLDVLEHFTDEAGEKFISHAVRNHGGILLSTPKYVGHQHDEDNEMQEHVSQWSKGDLRKFGHTYFVSDAISHIVLISRNQGLISHVRRQIFKRKLKHFLSRIPGVNWLYRKLVWRDSIFS